MPGSSELTLSLPHCPLLPPPPQTLFSTQTRSSWTVSCSVSHLYLHLWTCWTFYLESLLPPPSPCSSLFCLRFLQKHFEAHPSPTPHWDRCPFPWAPLATCTHLPLGPATLDSGGLPASLPDVYPLDCEQHLGTSCVLFILFQSLPRV